MELEEFIEQNNCLKNLNEYVMENEIHNYGQEEELKKLIQVLKKYKKKNAILIGKAGVGKTALVENLAEAINKLNVPYFLIDKTIIELSLAGAVAGTKYRGEFEEKLTNILDFLETRDDVIVFIDEIHNLLKAGGAEGAIGAGDILKPFIARSNVSIIGATTLEGYKKTIKRDGAMDRRFSKIKLMEPSMLDTINILTSVKDIYAKHYEVEINGWEIRNIVYRAKFRKGNYPDKAFDELESYCYGKGEKL